MVKSIEVLCHSGALNGVVTGHYFLRPQDIDSSPTGSDILFLYVSVSVILQTSV